MTVSTTSNKNRFLGNSATTVFAYAFIIRENSDLTVEIADPNDAATTLVLDTHYTVSGAGVPAGGDVTTLDLSAITGEIFPELPTGWSITIFRDVPLTQLTDLITQGVYSAEVFEAAYDYSMFAIQQLQEQISRSFLVTITSGLSGEDLIDQIQAAIAAAAASAVAAALSAAEAAASAGAALVSENNAAASAATLPTIGGGDIDKVIKVNSTEDGYRFAIEEKNIGDTENLGISYASPTFAITAKNGTALSSTNKGYIGMPSKTPGQIITVPVNAPQDFIDDAGASEIIGNLFGASTGIAWAEDVPFYIYAVLNDAETAVAFMISRVPHMTTSPAEGDIGAPDDPVADNSFSFFSFENIDEALYDLNPCVCIGSFRMQMSASDDWTVQTLENSDGLGLFQEGKSFCMPLNQNGAAVGTFFRDNGGTAPHFTSNAYQYEIAKSGKVTVHVRVDGDGGVDGVGAVQAQLVAPLLTFDYESPVYSYNAAFINSSVGGNRGVVAFIEDHADFIGFSELTTGAQVPNSDFGNGARTVNLTAIYLAAIS